LFNNDLTEQEVSDLINITTEIYKDKKITANTDFKSVLPEDFPTFTDLINKVHSYTAVENKKFNIRFLEKIVSILGLYCMPSEIASGNFGYL
jgi:hypothetical protein